VTADTHKPPELPDQEDRMPVKSIKTPHPAILPTDQLLRQCDLRTQRRSGPGGQHRNKTSSGVFLHHEPTGIAGEATERRSQADNRAVALSRLRMKLAVEVRTPSIFDGPKPDRLNENLEAELRASFAGGQLRINDRNPAKPAVLALLLNDLHAAGGQPSAVAKIWKTSTSAVIRMVRSHPPAFQSVNQIRAYHHRKPLK
jgi:hypothetical protein